MKKVKYSIETDGSLSGLEYKVEMRLNQGWELVSGAFVTKGHGYAQTLARNVEPDDMYARKRSEHI